MINPETHRETERESHGSMDDIWHPPSAFSGVETTCGHDTSATCGHHALQPVDSPQDAEDENLERPYIRENIGSN